MPDFGPHYPSGLRRIKELLMTRAGDDGAAFLGALENLAHNPALFLEAFATEGALTEDALGRLVLVHGGNTRNFRAVFAYDEYTQLVVQELTHPDGRFIVPEDFPPMRSRIGTRSCR